MEREKFVSEDKPEQGTVRVPRGLFNWLVEYAIDLRGAWDWKVGTTIRNRNVMKELDERIKESVELRNSTNKPHPMTTPTYRYLSEGELILEGDEYCSGGSWKPTTNWAGLIAGPVPGYYLYRRLVQPEQPSPYCCPDWPVQIALINRPVMDDCLRDGMANNVKGKPFKHCPWCGRERIL